MQKIHLVGARTHNLRSVTLDFAAGELVCLSGVSGSGKSSLAVDTLYAEGQRRFVESFSPYARQFLERLERPPMDGLDPVAAGVSVDRRTPVKSSRSTVATMADVEAFLSALFAREAVPVCPDCGLEAVETDAHTAAQTLTGELAEELLVTYPLRVGGTEQFLEVREGLLRDGYRRLLVRGETRDLDQIRPSEALGGSGEVQVVVDRIRDVRSGAKRLEEAIDQAWRKSQGTARVQSAEGTNRPVNRGLVCPRCARAFEPATTGLFSYQSPVGACPACKGFGRTIGLDLDKVIPDAALSLGAGAIRPWTGTSTSWERKELAKFAAAAKIPMDRPWRALSAAQQRKVLDGTGAAGTQYPGVRPWFQWLETRTYKMHVRVFLARYRSYDLCGSCGGRRLNEAALGYRVGGCNLAEWHSLELGDAARRLGDLHSSSAQGELIRRELAARLDYLVRVGLGYLTLDRQARTLSGGEAQRVSLTAALGSSLTGALFVIDEPTVGLHPTDVPPLLSAMRELAARGNATLVIEHDPAVVRAADRVIELGPAAGPHGGQVLFDGPPESLAARVDLPTGRALANLERRASTPREPRAPTSWLTVHKARAHNLRDLTVNVPLGVLCAVTGPSGSGKSTLIEHVLYRSLARARGVKDVEPPGEHERIEGDHRIARVTLVDQSPLGRTSRGNAATYTKSWDRFRARFADEPSARARGLDASYFSFNVARGRCEACSGEGYETVEMQFMADVALVCPSCQGRRFREEVLAVRHQGWTVAETLDHTVDEVLERFRGDAAITRALGPVSALGLGYLPLGQPLSTLSGGEAQRLKLARALGEEKTDALFLLDEPSAGLHPADLEPVLAALHALVRGGASVIAVDHDLDVMRASDWILDLGPGGGLTGGQLVAEGTPEQIARAQGATARALAGWMPEASKAPASAAPDANAIVVERAREHNLHEVSCDIPRGKLVVVTGPSGSGKSTLAFDVVFAEGQRRFLETLTPYARQFLPTMPRADVDRVVGVPPSIALEQRTARAGVNSTVATVTEVAHYLRLLFAKLGTAHCPRCDGAITAMSPDAILSRLHRIPGERVLLAPAVTGRKGTYLDLFNAAAREGITRARVDGALAATDSPPRLAKTREHDLAFVLYEGKLKKLDRPTLERALLWGQGAVTVARAPLDPTKADELRLSASRTCASCGTSVPELDPRFFSFNTKQGRCEACEGSGVEGGPEAALEGDARACKTCGGARLGPVPRGVRLLGLRYHEICHFSVRTALDHVRAQRFEGDEARVAEAPHAELVRRLEFLARVGLPYLTLDRPARTLSGGEMQRLRLSAQLGAGLTGALYVLDEPTIGLHPRDTSLLLANLTALVKTGSTVLVVEHDAETIRAADHLLDLGPSGGRAGGRIVAAGPPSSVLADPASPTGTALREARVLPERRLGPPKARLVLSGARANNLRDIDLDLPLGRLTVVAGVSGSGKSTLVRHVLYPAVRKALALATREPGHYRRIDGVEQLARAIEVDQSPIGRTPRSVPATFLGIWDDVRRVFASSPDAKVRGFDAARFSFNGTKGGRCRACEGQGVIWHEMSFLPDVVTTCDACDGTRFERATREVRYRGLSIGEVLRLSAEEATEFFSNHPAICRPLATLGDLGVGYLQLGQGSNTLSGGEAQRLKLAAELTAGTRHEPTLYVLDEPTTGLHQRDVMRLLSVLLRLVERGDTLVVIEHHPSVIASADHVVELGPEGGDEGGRLVAEGPPRAVARAKTPTGRVLRELFESA